MPVREADREYCLPVSEASKDKRTSASERGRQRGICPVSVKDCFVCEK